MSEISLLESLLSLGAGFVLAGVMFMMFLRYVRSNEKRWEQMLRDLRQDRKLDRKSRDKHTIAINELNILLRGANGKGCSGDKKAGRGGEKES